MQARSEDGMMVGSVYSRQVYRICALEESGGYEDRQDVQEWIAKSMGADNMCRRGVWKI